MKHGVGLGGKTERVRLQSWGQGGEDGRYWVVKERGDVRKGMGGFVGKETGGVEDWVVVYC